MSAKNNDSSRSGRAPLLIENAFEKETSESFVEQHFRKGPLHRAKDTGEFDLERIVEEFGEHLVRSTRELYPNPSSNTYSPQWNSAIFHCPDDVFWHFIAKSASYGEAFVDREY